ncbi:MAG: STAS domain-containing protein [Chitinispirillales bacterium]|jgi:anti-anti-sigma factor|nr:STAS domain-containing protein [Chitinispirillales bacterium]
MPLEIKKFQVPGKITFTLSGRLDTNTAPQLQAELIPAFDGANAVELDFSALTYISSAGLRVLLLGEKTAKSKDAAMPLLNVPQEIKDVFELTGFSEILKIV